MNKRAHWIWLLCAMAAGTALAVGAPTAWAHGTAAATGRAEETKKDEEDPEILLGRRNAEENDKQVKLVTDATVLERVNRIGQTIAAVANEVEVPATWGTPNVKKFQYSFKVVDDKDVNAYSLPGGFIYVNKGLLDYVRSDDELAGVLAHEVAHAAHHHMMKLIREQERIQQRALLPLIAVALLGGGGGEAIGNLLMAGQLYMVAKLNTYGVEAERDADQAAIRYLQRTPYNPVGILTFMERLAADERNRPQVELGIYRTHPPSPERASALLKELQGLNVVISRREVDPTIRAGVTSRSADGSALADITMRKVVIASVVGAGGATAEERARRVADRLNVLFDQGLRMYEVRLSNDKARVLAAQEVILAFTQADADAQKTTVTRLAESARDALRNLLWQEQFSGPSS